ncbi:14617_t:CDS:2, partial [Ambispora leptoticha]
KKLDKYQKENENLRNLVANLEKVPAEQEAAQIKRNLAGKDIFMSDFINLLTSKRKALGKKIRLSKRSLNNLQQSNDKFNQLLNQERYQTRQINVELQQEKTNYRDAVINLVKEKSQARKATVALKKRALELKNDLNSKRNEINNLKTKITTAEQDLGIGLNAEKEKERDEFESQLVHAQTESRNYKEQLEQQKDYQEVKQERDQLKTKLNQKEIEYNNSLQQKENQIITKIISELKLGLDKEANLEQVLDKVKELIINKNPETILHQQIAEKDKEIKKLREQNEKNYLPITRKQVEKKIKSLGIKSSIYEKKMLQLTSPQELENFYQEVINKEISKSREQERKVNNLNIVL